MKKWTPLDSDFVDTPINEKRKGIHVEISFSPYDIPEAFRGYYCDNVKRFVIEFRYMSDEPVRNSTLTPHVEAVEGYRSGRLHKLLINVDELDVSEVQLSLSKAVDEVLESPKWKVRSTDERRRVNERILDAVKREIIPKVESVP